MQLLVVIYFSIYMYMNDLTTAFYKKKIVKSTEVNNYITTFETWRNWKINTWLKNIKTFLSKYVIISKGILNFLIQVFTQRNMLEYPLFNFIVSCIKQNMICRIAPGYFMYTCNSGKSTNFYSIVQEKYLNSWLWYSTIWPSLVAQG